MRRSTRPAYEPGRDIALALDCPASEYFVEGAYRLEGENRVYTSAQMVDVLAAWCERYPIVPIEDGMSEHDWDGWKSLTDRLGRSVQLVGDDIFVTNTKILRQGIAKGDANSILIKINQIGTLTEPFGAITMATRARYTSVINVKYWAVREDAGGQWPARWSATGASVVGYGTGEMFG